MRTAEAWDLRTRVLARSPWVVPGLPGLTLPVLLAPGSGATCHGDVTPPTPGPAPADPAAHPVTLRLGRVSRAAPVFPEPGADSAPQHVRPGQRLEGDRGSLGGLVAGGGGLPGEACGARDERTGTRRHRGWNRGFQAGEGAGGTALAPARSGCTPTANGNGTSRPCWVTSPRSENQSEQMERLGRLQHHHRTHEGRKGAAYLRKLFPSLNNKGFLANDSAKHTI